MRNWPSHEGSRAENEDSIAAARRPASTHAASDTERQIGMTKLPSSSSSPSSAAAVAAVEAAAAHFLFDHSIGVSEPYSQHQVNRVTIDV